MLKFYALTSEERAALGKKGRDHVEKNYSFKKFSETWIKTVDEAIEKYGSWETRKHYRHWEIREI